MTIGIVGKYVKLEDAYLSVVESLHHAGFANKVMVRCEIYRLRKNNKRYSQRNAIRNSRNNCSGGFGKHAI